MTAWGWAVLGLLPSLLIAVVAAGRGALAGRLVAVQLASSLGVTIAVALSFVDDQPSSIDLALAAAVLALPATLLFALFAERWL